MPYSGYLDDGLAVLRTGLCGVIVTGHLSRGIVGCSALQGVLTMKAFSAICAPSAALTFSHVTASMLDSTVFYSQGALVVGAEVRVTHIKGGSR